MQLTDFKTLLKDDAPNASWHPLLQAMWWDANEDWDRAHQIAQDHHTRLGSLVHAYLHRKEGDESNAKYWYRQSGYSVFQGTLEEEWDTIVQTLLIEH